MRKYFVPVAAVAAIALSSAANAASPATADFDVKVTIDGVCTISTPPGDIDFGTITGEVLGTETATTSLSVSCNGLTPYTVSFTSASGSMSNTSPGGSDSISYTLSLDTSSGTSSGSHTITATLGAHSSPEEGDYLGTSTVEVAY